MLFLSFFFFNAPATTEIYTLSLHDALPIYIGELKGLESVRYGADLQSATPINSWQIQRFPAAMPDRKSTRLNSSHPSISYAVFCLKKKKKTQSTSTLAKITTDTPTATQSQH